MLAEERGRLKKKKSEESENAGAVARMSGIARPERISREDGRRAGKKRKPGTTRIGRVEGKTGDAASVAQRLADVDEVVVHAAEGTEQIRVDDALDRALAVG